MKATGGRDEGVRAAAARSTRNLILDAAERRFAERGFSGVSVREIAADAGLKNQASLYNHFDNKRAIYEAVLARGLDPILLVTAESGRAAAAGRRHGGAASDAFLDRTLDYLVEHPHLPRLIQRAALDDGRFLRSTLPGLLRPVYAQGLRVLAGSGNGWPAADLPHLAAGLYLLIFGYFANAEMLAAVVRGDPLSPAAIARQRRFVKVAVSRLMDSPRAPRAAPAKRAGSRRAQPVA
jgi:AcrR family transcriptional regulator